MDDKGKLICCRCSKKSLSSFLVDIRGWWEVVGKHVGEGSGLQWAGWEGHARSGWSLLIVFPPGALAEGNPFTGCWQPCSDTHSHSR